MCSLDVADEMRESEWIKIGVDRYTKDGLVPECTCGKTIPGESDLGFPHSNWRACQV